MSDRTDRPLPEIPPAEPSTTETLSVLDRATLGALRVAPRNLVSRLAGRVAGLPLPPPVRALAMRGFGRAVGVDFDEVRDPLSSFRSFQDFFTRRLVDGARPIDPGGDAFVSPCDGAWGESGIVRGGTLFQVKGSRYRLGDLFGPPSVAGAPALDPRAFEGGAYATLYLSPRDYHRFHSPCDAAISAARHVPGSLWPVNRIGLQGVDGLFARNERIVLVLDVDVEGETEGPTSGRLVYIAVGATMVGKVHVEVDPELTTNVGGATLRDRRIDPARTVAKGDELGRFEFGSTLVLVATPGLVDLDARPPGTPVRLGRRIGRLGG